MEKTEGQKEEKVAREMAELEFDRFASAWRLDTEVETMDDEDAEDFLNAKRRIVLAIIRGDASVNDDGDIIYNLFEPVGVLEQVTMKRPRGMAWKHTDKSKEGKLVGKTNHLIAAGINQLPMILTKMDGIDYKFMLAVYNLFLGS